MPLIMKMRRHIADCITGLHEPQKWLFFLIEKWKTSGLGMIYREVRKMTVLSHAHFEY